MKATSMYICLEGLKFFARHGVAPQETVVGANFTIDLKLKQILSMQPRQTDWREP